MIRVFTANISGANVYAFLSDSTTGYTFADMISSPNAYEEVRKATGVSPMFGEVECSIGNYKTKLFLLLLLANEVQPDATIDVTPILSKVLTVPQAARAAIVNSLPEDQQDIISDAIIQVNTMESLKTTGKVMLPDEAFAQSPELRGMQSHRKIAHISNERNLPVIQKDDSSTFVVPLPDVKDLHYRNSDSSPLIAPMDILKVIAPYRRAEAGGKLYSYNAIFHTPYFRLSPRFKRGSSDILEWIYGAYSNDGKQVMQHEQTMASNLETYISADTGTYVKEVVTALILNTRLGVEISRLLNLNDTSLADEICENLPGKSTEDFGLSLNQTDILELNESGWDRNAVLERITQKLTISKEFVKELIASQQSTNRVVYCSSMLSLWVFDDDFEQECATLLNAGGFITNDMFEFLRAFAVAAYSVNWGHTGATDALPELILAEDYASVSEAMGHYLNYQLSNMPIPSSVSLACLASTSLSAVSGGDDDDSDDSLEAIYLPFDRYITDDTRTKIAMGELPDNFFYTHPTAGETREASIVEYWRRVNGSANLEQYMIELMTCTGDYHELVSCIIHLLRWGANKPKTLVPLNGEKVKHVFDLSTGLSKDNIDSLDDSLLVMNNGCPYNFGKVVYSASKILVAESPIVGFMIYKDYSGHRKWYLASWRDMQELTATGKIEIGDFKAVTSISFAPESGVSLESLKDEPFSFYCREEVIEKALSMQVKPEELSDLVALTTPGIVNSIEYLRSIKQAPLTLRDHQFHALKDYLEKLASLYDHNSREISQVDNTAAARKVIEKFGGAAPKAQGLATLDLGGADLSFVDGDSENKYALLYDFDGVTGMPAISFTDATMQRLSTQLRNRVVLLLGENSECFFLCQKDIAPAEIKIGKKPDGTSKGITFDAQMFDKPLKNLMAGKEQTLNQKPLRLHASLRNLI